MIFPHEAVQPDDHAAAPAGWRVLVSLVRAWQCLGRIPRPDAEVVQAQRDIESAIEQLCYAIMPNLDEMLVEASQKGSTLPETAP
jgi:hypothetical protein